MLDSDSSSEEEAPLTKESFGILQLKKKVRIDQEKKKRAAITAAAKQSKVEQNQMKVELQPTVDTGTDQSKIKRYQMDVEQQSVDAGELNGHALNNVATRDDDVKHETAQSVDKDLPHSAAVTLSMVDKASASLPSLAVQADASSLVGEAEHSAADQSATSNQHHDNLSRVCEDIDKSDSKESAVTADQLTFQEKETLIALPAKEDDDMEVEIVEDHGVKSCYSDRKRSHIRQERIQNGADVTSVEDNSRSSINTRLTVDEGNKKMSHSGGSDSSALLIDLTSSGDEDEQSPTSQVWICGACTLENTNPLALDCEVCAVSRKESEKWKSAQWACSTCTLLNDKSSSVCEACQSPRDGNKSSVQSKQPRKKRRSAGDSERQRQLAMWEEDRASSNMFNKKRARHSFPGAAIASTSSSNYNAIDLQGLAAARRERQSMKIKPHHTAGGGDGTWMPGEFGLSGTVRYWDLTQTTSSSRHAQAKGGLCGAGHRHLATIMKTLNKRIPSVTLKRAQYLVNPTLLRKFEALKARLSGSHNVVYLFHGTGRENIDSIVSKGFLTRHAASGPGLIWFSRQSTYSYGFTASVPGKGLSSSSSASSSSSWGARGMSGGMMPDPVSMAPSGRMFICALLVARSSSETSNVGDKGQDVITMTKEAACLPCYLIDTTTDSPASFPGGLALPGFGHTSQSFQGKGNTLGGRKLG